MPRKARAAIAGVAGAAMLAAGSTVVTPPAAAQPTSFHLAPEVETIGWKRSQKWYKHWRGGQAPRHHRGRFHDFDDDNDFIGPVIGLGAGLIIGSMLARQGFAPGYSSRDARCAARFRSYDPVSNTYLGYDGRRHICR